VARTSGHRAEQLQLDFGPRDALAGGPREFTVGGRTLAVTDCFDVYWRFAAERQRVFHHRASGHPPPWTADPVLSRHKFCNVYRAADRVSQYLIAKVIYAGPQDPAELVFRTLLFRLFNRIETWELLVRELGAVPAWDGYRFAAYNEALSSAMRRGERIYTAAYIVPNPPFGETRKHGNHLRLLEHAMAAALPAKVAAAPGLRDVYRALLDLPSLGPFLAYQLAIDLAYSTATGADESQFVVAGPGALDGISKCFTDAGGMNAADVITWMRDTSRDHFARIGLDFTDLWGRWPTLIDFQNVFCEVSKYTRATHPHVLGVSGRTRIKQQFRGASGPLDYRFPPKWGLPPERTAGACGSPPGPR
jgi:alpha-glutamyl/putrescinyl thymine pyrophosphorylase clade 1